MNSIKNILKQTYDFDVKKNNSLNIYLLTSKHYKTQNLKKKVSVNK